MNRAQEGISAKNGPVAIVTGGSSGIGYAVAAELLRRGCRVYEISRRENPPAGVQHIGADLRLPGAAAEAVDRVIAAEGRVDILVNNAGMGISGAAEYTEAEEIRRLFSINFDAAAEMNAAVIAHMRTAGGGRIVQVGSLAALLPIPYQSFYSASKAALLSYGMALANELRPFGITVQTLLPGDIASGFTAARRKGSEGDAVYGGRITRAVSRMERDETHGLSSACAGRAIARAALSRSRRPYKTFGIGNRLILLLWRLLPARVVNAILYRLYG